MKREELLQAIAKETGLDLCQVETIYCSMVRIMTETLSRGEDILLAPEFGNFLSKEWDNPSLLDNSPRTRRAACYKIRFREGKELQKKLIIAKDGDENN